MRLRLFKQPLEVIIKLYVNSDLFWCTKVMLIDFNAEASALFLTAASGVAADGEYRAEYQHYGNDTG